MQCYDVSDLLYLTVGKERYRKKNNVRWCYTIALAEYITVS